MINARKNKGSEYTRFKKVNLKKDDEVICISGKDKGKKGKVLAIDKKRDRVVVTGINKRKKFQPATQENPQGGMIEIEYPIHISNVMIFSSKAKKGVRVGYQLDKNNKKVRVSRPEGKEI